MKYRTQKPPVNLPIDASEGDMWEDGAPEERERQHAFELRLRFAFAASCVAALLVVSMMVGQEQIARVANLSFHSIPRADFLAIIHRSSLGASTPEYGGLLRSLMQGNR
jgi:hypothetical protein